VANHRKHPLSVSLPEDATTGHETADSAQSSERRTGQPAPVPGDVRPGQCRPEPRAAGPPGRPGSPPRGIEHKPNPNETEAVRSVKSRTAGEAMSGPAASAGPARSGCCDETADRPRGRRWSGPRRRLPSDLAIRAWFRPRLSLQIVIMTMRLRAGQFPSGQKTAPNNRYISCIPDDAWHLEAAVTAGQAGASA
jgi:hypothetical protein